MKKIMILGAGIYQVPLIKTAKKLGLYTIVVSIPGNYPGFELADKVYYENTVDDEKILEIAKEEQIDGIITTGTDVCVITIGKVCDAMGLAGLSYEAAQIAVDKMLMKTKYEEYGVRTARFRKVLFSDPDIKKTIEGLEFPLIFKSVDSSGSRGITPGRLLRQVRFCYELCKRKYKKRLFLNRRIRRRRRIRCTGICIQWGSTVHSSSRRLCIPRRYWCPNRSLCSIQLKRRRNRRCQRTASRCSKAMQLDNCAINADFILKDNKTYVLELGGRCGATCLAELTSIYYGFDYYEKFLELHLEKTLTSHLTNHSYRMPATFS